MRKALCTMTIFLLLTACGGNAKEKAPGANAAEKEIAKASKALFEAVDKGDLDKLKELLVAGVDVNVKDGKDRTALHLAALAGKTELVKLLLESGADVNARDKLRQTPLHLAASLGVSSLAELLLAKGADPYALDIFGQTPMHTAATQARLGFVKFLTSKGVDIRIRGSGGLTPLHAVAEWHPVMGRTDDERKRDIKWLHKVAKFLIDKGVGPDARDDRGMTPLHRAAERDFNEFASFLIKNGADVNAKDDDGRTPLDLAVNSAGPGMIILLREKGGRIEKAVPSNLVECVKHRNIQKLKEFLRAIADEKSKEKELRAALQLAVTLDDKEVVELLLRYGASANGPLFHQAVEVGNIEIIELLIAAGADINVKSFFRSRTPLHEAVRSGHIDVAELLIIEGAELNAQDSMLATPLDWARTKEMKQLLRSHGAVSGKELDQNEDN